MVMFCKRAAGHNLRLSGSAGLVVFLLLDLHVRIAEFSLGLRFTEIKHMTFALASTALIQDQPCTSRLEEDMESAFKSLSISETEIQ